MKPIEFIKLFMIILIAGMLIGIMQWLPWPGRVMFINLYPFRDGELQLSHLTRELHSIRVHGWAQFATANGGLAMLAFVFGFSVYNFSGKFRVAALALMFLAVLNLIVSQARAGMLVFVFAIILLCII
ncbi:hypothetical protein [Paenibacillus sp. 1011MAR3C5]|uniref:hypothetical protein n=1 Tax=Paenibacillus sp. 1011MAR3C5 TaxID=1675787 RepID=UPI0011C3C48D|nr:hypothetical protein [Paenibacillus sp. 1011MAR3C5]